MNSSSGNNGVACVLVLALALLTPPVSAAQTSAISSQPNRLTLPQAIAMADAHYPRIRAALEQQIAAKNTIAVARTAYLPRVDTLWQTNRATANNIY